MEYKPLPKIRTIETLDSNDILEIVLKDLEKYNVPAEAWGKIIKEYIKPLLNIIETEKRRYYLGEG